jgi:hypothetical protein
MSVAAAALHLRDDATVLDGLRALLGGGSTTQVAVLPGSGRPRHLVPLRPGPVAAAALAGRAGDRGLAGRLATGALAVAARAGAGRLVPAARVVEGGDGPSLADWLDDVLGVRGCAVAVGVGPPRGNRKPVLQVLTPDGTTVAWGKVGWDLLTRRLVGDEADVLDRLGGALAPGVTVPVVRARAPWQGTEVVLTEPLPLRPQARRPLRPDPDLLRAVAGPPGALDPWHGATARRLAAVPGGDDLVPVLDRVADRLAAGGVRGARWHGDLTPWNVGPVPGGRAVWDWERSAAPVPLGLDAVHASYAVATLRDGVAVADALAAAADDATGALGAIGVPSAAVPAMAAAYAIELLLRQEGDRAHWTSPALDRTCAALAGALTDRRLLS